MKNTYFTLLLLALVGCQSDFGPQTLVPDFSSLDFGAVAVGSPVYKREGITNNTTRTYFLHPVVTDSSFSILNFDADTLLPRFTSGFYVEFLPRRSGRIIDTITFYAPDSSIVLRIPLAGTGL